MLPEEREFPQFALAVGKGLKVAILTDIDVFLMFCAALLWKRGGLGKVLLAYVVARRGDQYMTVFASKMDRIALVMAKNHE